MRGSNTSVAGLTDRRWLGWDLYFPDTEKNADDERATVIRAFRQHFVRVNAAERLGNASCLKLDWRTLLHDNIVPDLASYVTNEPDNAIPCISLALYQAVHDARSDEELLGQTGALPERLEVEITHFEPLTAMKRVKASRVGRFIAVQGTVIRVGPIKPLVMEMPFQCTRCGTEQWVRLPDGKFTPPSRCLGSGCRSKGFAPLRDDAVTTDWQRIRLQELVLDTMNADVGRVPRTMDIEVCGHLVDRCVPGDTVLVSGVVKMAAEQERRPAAANAGRAQTLYMLYLDAHSISNFKTDTSAQDKASQFSPSDMYAINEISQNEDLVHLIIGSLAPSIFGHELVKAGLVLALFGGTSQQLGDKPSSISLRGDPHVLVVGDPGLGKSQMLQAVAAAAPRGVYVCGNTTTSAGLTVSVLRDSGGDFALEAGALVLGDQGVTCIDEFDKMTAEHQALLEAMEQQSISVAKAGIVCTLPARTSVIAAANPIGGHYQRSKTVHENLRMGDALMSRFDLIFILLDRPDARLDQLLSEHVMALHSNGPGRAVTMAQRVVASSSQQASGASQIPGGQEDSLQQRLAKPLADPIPIPLLRKYISYARQFVHPVLSTEAKKVIQNFYLSLRERHGRVDSTPITTRQLESIIRLAQARARLELREEVTQEDALDVLEVIKESMVSVLTNEMGQIDFSRATGVSKRRETDSFVQELHRVAERTQNNLFSYEHLLEIGTGMGLPRVTFRDFVEQLNAHNYLLKRSRNMYLLASY